MKLKSVLLLAIVLCFTTQNYAQNRRYLDQIFTSVDVTYNQMYGANYSVLNTFFQPTVAHTFLDTLKMDIYKPSGDAATNRPVIIYLPTGNFFPFPLNGSCGGTLRDSSNVEFATRLAKMGYVVCVTDYRKGWGPTATSETARRFTLINGAYRGVQDVRTAIRFLKKSVAVGGNNLGIDPNKIVVWGQGTGGYLSLATAFLNTFEEIYTTPDPNKFKIQIQPGVFFPMVNQGYNGDIYGVQETVGKVDATLNAIAPNLLVGDTLYVPNHIGYTSNFSLAVNMGGALGDSTWQDAGEIPLISYHVPDDFFAPCTTDVLNVPTTNGPLPVVEVSGSCHVQTYTQAYGNNAPFTTIPVGYDPMGTIAKTINGGLDGFFPFNGTPNNSSAPWEWAGPGTNPAADCNTNAATAKVYIDTIIQFFAPRACQTLGLGCDYTSSVKELTAEQVGLGIAPIPASNVIYFNTKDANMLDINVFDMNGRLVLANNGINATTYEMQRGYLKAGFYLAEIRFEQGTVRKKLVIMD